jgi:hypothetical protein
MFAIGIKPPIDNLKPQMSVNKMGWIIYYYDFMAVLSKPGRNL